MAVNILVPSKKYSGIMKIVCGVFVIATIVSPIKQIMNFEISDTDKYFRDDKFEYSVTESKEKFDRALLSRGLSDLEDEIKESIRREFGISASISLDENGINVYLTDGDDSVKDKISDYLGERYSADNIFVN